ncbi:interleukin-20 receptor subunit alpha [Polypterus senegalus]|uniref:interleukin-20 receptor subunit alpha n=1 Tax=Polypterus senegalus TaxID=55291 RepID=UPI00196329AA|nr:interleukin-20 receptor subunit alpha [Polypterus senegalus]
MLRLGYSTEVTLHLTLLVSDIICFGMIPKPCNVSFYSLNMRNILVWHPGEGVTEKLNYTVQYLTYGKKTNEYVRHCINIASLSCDLSEETRNPDSAYYGRVKASLGDNSSEWAYTRKFRPKYDTLFGPPALDLIPDKEAILIIIKDPEDWQNNSKTKRSMADYYPSLQYNITVYNDKTRRSFFFLLKNNSIRLSSLHSGTKYCVSASSHVQLFSKYSNLSDEVCVTTPQDALWGTMIFIIYACILTPIIILSLIAVGGCLMYRYVFGNKQVQPNNLVLQHHCETQKEIVLLPCDDVALSKIAFSAINWSSIDPARKGLQTLEQELEKVISYAPQLTAYLPSHNQSSNDHGSECILSDNCEYGIVTSTEQPCGVDEVENIACQSQTGISLNTSIPPLDSQINALIKQQNQKACKCAYVMQTVIVTSKNSDQSKLVPSLDFKNEDGQGEDSNIFIDWDCEMRRLNFPILEHEENEEQELHPCVVQEETEKLLSTVFVRQCSEDIINNEDVYLTKLISDWELNVNMDS